VEEEVENCKIFRKFESMIKKKVKRNFGGGKEKNILG